MANEAKSHTYFYSAGDLSEDPAGRIPSQKEGAP
jgi:hypothetical protein